MQEMNVSTDSTVDNIFIDFIIDDLSKAEWATKKIIKYQNDIQSKIEQARKMKDNYLAEVDNWLKSETEDAQRNIDSLSAMLQPFIENELAGKKKRSINLPSGRAGFKKGNTTFYYGNDKASKDNQQLLAFLLDNHYNEYVKTEISESVDWGNFKKQLAVTDDGNVVIASTGEIIDVMTANQEPDKFYVQAVK